MNLLMLIFLFLLGLAMGSFLNAWIYRTRAGKSVAKGFSICPKCKKKIRWYDNIPVFGFLILKGKCRDCKLNISWQYPLVEFWMSLVFVFVGFIEFENWVSIARNLFIIFFLTFIFVYDMNYQEIPDVSVIFPAIFLLIFSLVAESGNLISLIAGMLIGGGFFLLQWIISRGSWIGMGDIKLGFFMGIILGWPFILIALALAYIGGSIINIPRLILNKRIARAKVAFGSYLTVATFVTMFWGEEILGWYLGLL